MDGIVMFGGFILLGTGGFWLMRKLDQFLEQGGFSSGSMDTPHKGHLEPLPRAHPKGGHSARPAPSASVTAALPMDSVR